MKREHRNLSWTVTSEILKIFPREEKRSLRVRACCVPKSWNSTETPRNCFPRRDSTAQRIKAVTQHTALGREEDFHIPCISCTAAPGWTGGDGSPPATWDTHPQPHSARASRVHVQPVCRLHTGHLFFLVYLQANFCASASPQRYVWALHRSPWVAWSLSVDASTSCNKELLVFPLSRCTESLGELQILWSRAWTSIWSPQTKYQCLCWWANFPCSKTCMYSLLTL